MSFNAALVDRFTQMAKLMELLGEDSFKSAAHARAARVLGDHPHDLEVVASSDKAKSALMEIEGVGAKIADKIIEFAKTGSIKELDGLKEKAPAGLLAVIEIPGLGPKTAAVLWRQGGVESVADLKRIIADGSILGLPRMGAKSVEKIKESLAVLEEGAQRLHLGLAMPIAERIVESMLKVPGVQRAAFAGSLRRGKETVGDLDVLVCTTDPSAAAGAFVELPGVRTVLVQGERKCSIRLAINPDMGRWGGEAPSDAASVASGTIQVDLRVIDDSCWGAAFMYFTGSKEHNVRMRERALKMGLTLNEYGLFPEDLSTTEAPQKRGIAPVASKTEEEIYQALGMAWIAPELREDRGEMTAFEVVERADALGGHPSHAPRRKGAGRVVDEHRDDRLFASGLITLADIKAELHAHTTASDGVMSIVELARAAQRRGFHTIAVTDHSKSSPLAGGLSPERLRQHIMDVRAAQQELPEIRVLAGSEVDILASGELDYDDELLAALDVVVASPHAALSQDSLAATKRLLKAIEHPLVHILGHPTGRLINRRAGLSPDVPALVAAAKACGTAMEINTHWYRLDLRDTHARVVADAGALVAINSDVHVPDDFDNLRFGVATARRGWISARACVNTWSAGELSAWLKKKR